MPIASYLLRCSDRGTQPCQDATLQRLHGMREELSTAKAQLAEACEHCASHNECQTHNCNAAAISALLQCSEGCMRTVVVAQAQAARHAAELELQGALCVSSHCVRVATAVWDGWGVGVHVYALA